MPFDSIEQVVAAVRDDVAAVLEASEDQRSRLIPPRDSSEGFQEAAAGLLSDTMGVVQWSYSAETDGEFLGAGRSDVVEENLITVRGVTIVTYGEQDQHTFERYIDWVDTFAQLGLTVSWRRAVGEAVVGG
jgi:hypothetical protein